jgi:hypothetical protein
MIALLFSIIHSFSHLLCFPDEQIQTVQLLLAIMQRVQLVTAAAAQTPDQILLRTGGVERLGSGNAGFIASGILHLTAKADSFVHIRFLRFISASSL